MELLSAVPWLIIDDLGMRKLGPTAAEELLEIVMRRYERASTLVTSNRPIDDWGSCSATRRPSPPCWTACCTMVTSSNAGRGAGGPSRWRNPPRQKSHDQNHERPRENAATSFGTRFFSSFEEELALHQKIRPGADNLRSGCRQGSGPASRRSARTLLRVLDCALA